MNHQSKESTRGDVASFATRLRKYTGAFRRFVHNSETEMDDTLQELWNRIVDTREPFYFDADSDMAKFTFERGRGFHIATSTRRFHRPRKTHKPDSVTIIMGGFKDEYDDPEGQLIPCDKARTIDCCYFGMGEEEVELAMFFIQQLMDRPSTHKKARSIHQSAKIKRRRSQEEVDDGTHDR